MTEYTPLEGFYDLRAFKIPKKEFAALYRIQKFLHKVETDRRAGKIHPQIMEVRELSGKYQHTLFSFPVIKPELL